MNRDRRSTGCYNFLRIVVPFSIVASFGVSHSKLKYSSWYKIVVSEIKLMKAYVPSKRFERSKISVHAQFWNV